MQTRPTPSDHGRDAHARSWQLLRERLMGCFGEMPGLIGTADEFSRLLGVPPPACRALLDRLTAERLLKRTRDGRYTRCADV